MGARGQKPTIEEQEGLLSKMVQAEYLLDHPCQMCNGKEGSCYNFFCLICQMGSLCASLFQTSGNPHFQHDKIQVFKTSYQYVVRETEMQAHFDITRLVQKYNSNGTKCYYLRTKQTSVGPSSSGSSTNSHHHSCHQGPSNNPATSTSTSNNQRRSPCQGCGKMFTLPRDANAPSGLVCSVECLLQHNNNARLKLQGNIGRNKARKQKKPTRSPMA